MLFWQGFLLQAGLILALGAQNIFVLESGLKRQHHLAVAATCALCDLVLIMLGVSLTHQVTTSFPLAKVIFGATGAALILVYAMQKFRESLRAGEELSAPLAQANLPATIGLALGFSLLNPHVYLDTIFLIGGYAASFEPYTDRMLFGAGAACFSSIWFFGLSFGAASASEFFRRPKARRTLVLASAITLSVMGVLLANEVVNWIREMS